MDVKLSPAKSLTFPLFSSWNFFNPVNVKFGRDCRQLLPNVLRTKKLLIVTSSRGRKQFSSDNYLCSFLSNNQICWVDNIVENPSVSLLQDEIIRLNEKSFDAVLGFGGGSAMDAAKILNVANSEDCKQYTLSELLCNSKLHKDVKVKPLYAIPTTSGTGSEVTPFATVWDHERKKKLSLSGDSVWPYAAYIDPALVDSLPHSSTISTGLDAINQAAESLWNRNATPVTIGMSIRSLQLGFRALSSIASGNFGLAERDQMSEASLLAGLAISQTRTALCHSISYPITLHFGVPHGLACAFTMPYVLRHNLKSEDSRFTQASLALCGSSDFQLLCSLFDELHNSLRVRELVKKRIPSLQSLMSLETEMFTVGRSDNNLMNVSSLSDILSAAWNGTQSFRVPTTQ